MTPGKGMAGQKKITKMVFCIKIPGRINMSTLYIYLSAKRCIYSFFCLQELNKSKYFVIFQA